MPISDASSTSNETVRELNTTWVECDYCQGTGVDPTDPLQPCPNCLGYTGAYISLD